MDFCKPRHSRLRKSRRHYCWTLDSSLDSMAAGGCGAGCGVYIYCKVFAEGGIIYLLPSDTEQPLPLCSFTDL